MHRTPGWYKVRTKKGWQLARWPLESNILGTWTATNMKQVEGMVIEVQKTFLAPYGWLPKKANTSAKL